MGIKLAFLPPPSFLFVLFYLIILSEYMLVHHEGQSSLELELLTVVRYHMSTGNGTRVC